MNLPSSAGIQVGILLVCAGVADARPEAPQLFCKTYPQVPSCEATIPSCLLCHSQPPALNPYGDALRRKGTLLGNFAEALPPALRAAEDLDSDGDGVANFDELFQATFPGDPLSHFVPRAPGNLPDGSGYTLGTWDAAFALRRIKAAFCGISPSYEEMKALQNAPNPKVLLHETLDRCLQSEYWRTEAVPRLADGRIRPIASLAHCQNMIANFEYDYHLFTWAMTGGRDARILLQADFHIAPTIDGTLAVVDESTGPAPAPSQRAGIACKSVIGAPTSAAFGGQPLQKSRRAGMLTTQWFLVINTQATFLPRTTAALAYRSWMGTDISLYEGMYPVAGEPRDIDKKGVKAHPCAFCHSTLDPLSYSFAYYQGVGFGGGGVSGSYLRDRYQRAPGLPDAVRKDWADDPPKPHLFAEPLPLEAATGDGSSLKEMALRMTASDGFARNLALIIFQHATGGMPEPKDWQEFSSLIQSLKDNRYSVNAMIHSLVDSSAFGTP